MTAKERQIAEYREKYFVSKLLLLQLFRRRHPFGSELFTFFDRAICHRLGVIDQCPPSTTELLYSRASEMSTEDEAA